MADVEERSPSGAPNHAAPLLRIRDARVLKGRSPAAVLDGLSVEIPQGEHTAILGPNGAGKSSLIKLITQEYRPLAPPNGEPVVEIFGRDRWDVFELRTLLGIVSPDHAAMLVEPNGRALRGMDIVLSGYFASRGVQAHHHVGDEMRAGAARALALMEATHLGQKSIAEMSTGEARRVLIARALVADPPALLLDEPTGGLDMVARHRFLDTVRVLARMGKTIVLVTHRLEEVIPEIQRVVLLKGGRVAYEGAKCVVLREEPLSQTFGARVQVEELQDGYYTAWMSGE